MKALQSRVAVVTGAGSGIGHATAVALAARGCRVAAVDIDLDLASLTVDEIKNAGGFGAAFRADVSDWDQMQNLREQVLASFGGCNIVVNNAGVTTAGDFLAESHEDTEWMMGINVWGVLNGCKAFLPSLLAGDEGHIVNIASMAGLLGLPHNATYGLTKGAVRSFSEGLRSELVTTDVGVSVIFPGAIATNIARSARGSHADRLRELGNSKWAPRLLTSAESVARAVIKAIEHDRPRSVVGVDSHLVSLATRLLPGRSGIVGRLTSRIKT